MRMCGECCGGPLAKATAEVNLARAITVEAGEQLIRLVQIISRETEALHRPSKLALRHHLVTCARTGEVS